MREKGENIMRELTVGSRRFTTITVLDEPGQGGACHEYCISPAVRRQDTPAGEFGHISFQNGPIKENAINGCHQEDLIAIVIDRLQHFQKGSFKYRTKDREKRGVEGTNVN